MKKDFEKFLEENGYETVSLNSIEFARLKRNQNDNELEFSFCIAIYTTEEEKKQMPIPKLSSLLSVPQDTIFEHGILVGRFGEDKVATIASGAKVKFPNSVNNFIYANDNSWKYKLLKQIRKAGI
jgi:predicted nucleotide-binding protein